jgi:hypothetical protein
MTNGQGLAPFLSRPGWCCVPPEGTNPIGFGLQEMPKASPRIAELSKVVGSPNGTPIAALPAWIDESVGFGARWLGTGYRLPATNPADPSLTSDSWPDGAEAPAKSLASTARRRTILRNQTL